MCWGLGHLIKSFPQLCEAADYLYFIDKKVNGQREIDVPQGQTVEVQSQDLNYVYGMTKSMPWGWFWPDSLGSLLQTDNWQGEESHIWHLRPSIHVLVSIHTEIMHSVMNLLGQVSALRQRGQKAKQKDLKHWNQKALRLKSIFFTWGVTLSGPQCLYLFNGGNNTYLERSL